MKTHSTIAGNHYTVTSPNGGTVTDAAGKLNKVVGAGDQLTVMAPSEALYCSDDDSDIRKANFKNARLALRMLGAGDNLLPSGYTRLEYLEATGEQYIDTGVPLSSEVDLLVDFAPVFNGDSHVLFGTRRDDIATNRGTYALIMPTAGQIVIWRHDRRMVLQGVSQARHTLELTSTALVLDGAVKSTYTQEPWSYTLPCYLGAAITHTEVVQLPLVGKLYGFALTQSGSKRLNFIPALDPTGAPCMFDTVSRKPFYNAGTGDFVYPTETATYGLRRVLPDWGKLTPTGLRRLYHAPAWYKGELYDYALENGYKPIVEEPAPEEGYWVPVWHDREDCIELEWVETEPPAEEELSTDK